MKDRKLPAETAAGVGRREKDFRSLLVLLDDLAAIHATKAQEVSNDYERGLHHGQQQMAEFIQCWISKRLQRKEG